MLPVTFDWAQISYIGSPLMTPFWAAANVVGGLLLVMWIIAPIMCTLPYSFLSQDSCLTRSQTTRMRSTVRSCQYCRAMCLTTRRSRTTFRASSPRSSCLTRRRTRATVRYLCQSRRSLTIVRRKLADGWLQICTLVWPAVCRLDRSGDTHGLLARQGHLATVEEGHARALSPTCWRPRIRTARGTVGVGS